MIDDEKSSDVSKLGGATTGAGTTADGGRGCKTTMTSSPVAAAAKSTTKLDALLLHGRSSDRPKPLSARSLPTLMSESLADQPWETVGLLDDPAIKATTDFEITVEQLSSILENRLADVIAERKREREEKEGAAALAKRGMWTSTSQIGLAAPTSSSQPSKPQSQHQHQPSWPSRGGATHRRRRRRGGDNKLAGSLPSSPFDSMPHESSSAADIILSPATRSELRDYVRTVGASYRDCRYHKFEHAAHVTASANKLLDLMEECEDETEEERREEAEAEEEGGGGNGGAGFRRDHRHQQHEASARGEGGGPSPTKPSSARRKYDRTMSLADSEHLEEPACSYATGDPTVPTVHIDHPKLGEFVRRMSDLHASRQQAQRRGSVDTTSQSKSSAEHANRNSRRESGLSAATSGTETDQQQQQQQHDGGGGGVGAPDQSSQFYFDDVSRHHLHSPTFSVATDPLTKFAVVYAALIHDVDHQGVPNRQLVAEGDDLALLYNDKSVAEQHSLRVAFQLLMQPQFATLRHDLIPTSSDQFTFRRLVIELVLCTDIASPERMLLAKSKWVEAFGELPRDDAGDGIATVTASRPSVVNSAGGRRGAAPRRASLGVPGYAPSFYPGENVQYHPDHQGGINAHHTSQGRLVHGHQHHRQGHANQGGECLGIRRALHLNGSTIEFYAAPGDVAAATSSNDGSSHGINGTIASSSPWAATLLAEKRLRSSVVLEALMNAADVAHTLQGWDNFLKWNRKLYEELFHAYHVSGRVQMGESDPSVGWRDSQLFFYDIYILPLARKLRRCGAFGRQRGREIVRNAKGVRKRWEAEGGEVTERMIREVREKWEREQQEEERRRKEGENEARQAEAPAHATATATEATTTAEATESKTAEKKSV